MAKQLLILLTALALTGCMGYKDRIVVKTVEVKVPTYIKVEVPEALAQCGTAKPGFKFYPSPAGGNDILIREEDQPAFRAWVEDKQRCVNAWKAWSK